MDDFLLFFIYIDEDLVRNLFGSVLSGYIEARTIKVIQDRSISIHSGDGGSEGSSGEERATQEERDGYKLKNCVDVDNSRLDKNWANWLEGKQYNRIEESLTRIYGVLTFHNELYSNLKKNTKINALSTIRNKIKTLKIGDYIDLEGVIKTNSVLRYVDKVINIIVSYTPEKLNTLLEENKNRFMDYNVILRLLTHLKETLSMNNTEDLIMETSDGDYIVMVVKNSCFLKGKCNIFDKVECNCHVFGKILNICSNEDRGLSLYRKTCCEDYYEELLEQIDGYLAILHENGILIPCRPKCRVNGDSLVVVPISIYH